ncbi:MAG: ABC transporter ATP-binding protein [Lachnospiraceae bacterium]|nr:ABC transporter ATP-binding protein [Lachnospiraceae bacterium]
MLEFQNVSFTYPGAEAPIMENLSFSVEAGSFVSIIGASGSGKSTLFRLLNSLEELQEGTITVNGRDIRSLSHYTSYMPQQDLLFPWRTVEKNVMLPMQVQKVPKEERKRVAAQMLAKVGLTDWANSYPRELSGGMRQRVSFARTLCAGSDLLLLDEPFSALDSITRISLQEWLREQWESLDKTILFITHDVEEAIFLSEKILVLTGSPVTGLKEFTVPLPGKRTREMLLQGEIQQLKETLVELLRSEAAE